MKKIFILLTLVLIQSNSFAQHLISGIVTDSKSHKSISFATLEIMGKGVGTAANDKGFFNWRIDDKYINDTVSITALGYEKSDIVLKKLMNQNNIEIKLKSRIFDLPCFVIKNTKPKVVKVGSRKKFMLFSGVYGNAGSMHAMYIKVDSNIYGILKTVGVYITKHGKSKGSLQIRLLNLAGDSILPGEDMIKESLLISGSEGGGWEDIDVSKYRIPIPQKGFFISVEIVKTSEDYYYKGPYGQTGYGPVLGHTSEFDQCYTFYRHPGNQWYKNNAGGGEVYFNIMVRARLSTW